MTRPMPGPPERTSHDRHSAAGFIRSDCPWCSSFRPDESKRLTDAECAAEYWRAEAEEADARGRSWFYEDPATVNAERVKASLAANRARTWHRFARTPHALEVEA